MIIDFFFKTHGRLKTFGDIKWIDSAVERFFTQDIEILASETAQVVELAAEAQKREQLGSTYVKGLSAIDQAKNRMRITGYEELNRVQSQSNQVKGLKAKLLKAARG